MRLLCWIDVYLSTQFYSYNNNCCNEYKINILIYDCDHTGIAL